MGDDASVTVLAVVCGTVVAVCLIAVLVARAGGFFAELRYLNMEIGRTRGRERKHWKRKRRRLFLSLIPFARYR